MRNWTAEQRLRQSEAIRRWKPWELSTGAKTAQGKTVSSNNATKTGDSASVRELVKDLNRLLKKQRGIIS